MKKFKTIPKFKSLAIEKKFWEEHDSTEYVDWDRAKPTVFPNLKPSTKTISLRLPEHLLHEIRILANREDVPYQSFIKMLLAQEVRHRTKGQ